VARISAVMSVFNGAAYLAESVESILAQSYTDFELIIVDDASTDETGRILTSFTDPRIRVLHNQNNAGLAVSLNRGIAVASGEFIARQDADDISEPDRFARQVAFLDGHPEVALVGTAHREIDAAGRELALVDAHCDHVSIIWAMLFFCPFVHSAVMFRRAAVLQSVGLYDPSYRYSMDFEYWRRIAARFRVANLKEPLVRLRMHDSSMTATFGSHTREGQHLRVAAMIELLPEKQVRGTAEELYGVLSALIAGPPSAYSAAQLLEGVSEVLALQSAFATRHKLRAEEAARLRADVRRHVGLTLLRYGRRELQRGLRGARAASDLARRALIVYPRLILHPRTTLDALRLNADRDRAGSDAESRHREGSSGP
jgi:hypothetical protein